MPATAGRCRMPANNRVHSSAALQTHGIWQSAIGYDPYAPDEKKAGAEGEDNAYDSFQGLLQLAKLTGSNADEARGACKKCHRVGHLTFQCRNFLTAKEDVNVPAELAGGLNGHGKKGDEAEESDVSVSEDESEDGRGLAEAARARGLLPGRRHGDEGEKKASLEKKKKKKSKDKKKRRKSKRDVSSDSDDDSPSDSEDSSDSEDDRRRRRSAKDKKRKSKKSSRRHRRRSDSSDGSEDESDSEGSSEEERRRKRKRKDKERRRRDRD